MHISKYYEFTRVFVPFMNAAAWKLLSTGQLRERERRNGERSATQSSIQLFTMHADRRMTINTSTEQMKKEEKEEVVARSKWPCTTLEKACILAQ